MNFGQQPNMPVHGKRDQKCQDCAHHRRLCFASKLFKFSALLLPPAIPIWRIRYQFSISKNQTPRAFCDSKQKLLSFLLYPQLFFIQPVSVFFCVPCVFFWVISPYVYIKLSVVLIFTRYVLVAKIENLLWKTKENKFH